MGAGSRLPDSASVVDHRTIDLVVTAFDRQSASPVKKRGQHAKSTGCPLSDLIYVTRPHQLLIDSQPQITCCIDPLDLLTKDMDRPVILDVPCGIKEVRRSSRPRW